MKIAPPQPFFFKHGKRAVLLLHGFTGNSSDVRMFGRFLEKKEYTSLAPHYRGHGVPPEQLIETNPEQWWEDVVAAYKELQQAGYNEIAVVGLSLGGVFALKLALHFPVVGVATMCSPMTMRTTEKMFEGVLKYAQDYKRYEGKDTEAIEREVTLIEEKGMPSLKELRELVYDVSEQIDQLYAPLFVIQAQHDEVIDSASATYIYETASSTIKKLKWYEKSGHVITLGPEKAQLHEDLYEFLESLNWNV